MQQTTANGLFQLSLQHVHVYGGARLHGKPGRECADAKGSRKQVPIDAGTYEIYHLSSIRFAAVIVPVV